MDKERAVNNMIAGCYEKLEATNDPEQRAFWVRMIRHYEKLWQKI